MDGRNNARVIDRLVHRPVRAGPRRQGVEALCAEVGDGEVQAAMYPGAQGVQRRHAAWYLALAHSPEMAVAYAQYWDTTHRDGQVEHTTKELMRIAISQLLGCDFCAQQRSVVALEEGWRGEVAHVAVTDDRGSVRRHKVTDPSFRNWNALALAMRGNQISDFPLCNKSFNLSYAGHDL